jgi:hypothetical protein
MTRHAFALSHQPSSAMFAQVCDRFAGTTPTLTDVAGFAGPKTYALILLLFALPEALPLPVAGMSTILSIPLLLVSVQMLLHGPDPCLPVWLGRRRVPLRLLQAASKRIGGALRRIDGISRPRWQGMADQTRLIGAVCFVLAGVIALPIPFGNMLPALCLLGIAVGILQRDGVLIALSMAIGGIVVAGFSTLIAAAGSALLTGLLGFGG